MSENIQRKKNPSSKCSFEENEMKEENKKTGAKAEKKQDLAFASGEELLTFVKKAGEPAYRAKQIMEWISKKRISDPDKMTNLSASLREKLKEYFSCSAVKILETRRSADGSCKLLLELGDGESIECAIIAAQDERNTFCLSTQVGCPVRCSFCASGEHGLVRNLTAGEIVEQYLLCSSIIGKAPDNVVIMGIGEPLLNYDNLVGALEKICDPQGIALAARRVTISTSGWTPGIRNLAKKGRQWNLAVSLHAPDDKTRALLIPGKFRRDIKDILDACKLHREATGRLLTFEYVLLKDVNDAKEFASGLVKVAKAADAKVNLIPYNEANGGFSRPDRETVKKFASVLERAGVPVTVRVEKGFESDAACGQLRSSAAKRRKK